MGVKIWYYNSINWSDKVTVKTLTENNETIENLKNVQHDTIVNISNGKRKRKNVMFHLFYLNLKVQRSDLSQ